MYFGYIFYEGNAYMEKLIIFFFVLTFILIIIIFYNIYDIKKTSSKSLAPFGYFLFYTDEKGILKKENVIYSKLLFSEKYNLTGKPDFVYKKGKKLFPVELKSGKIKKEKLPHQGDLLQLIAYFLILEDLYGAKVKKGKLIYSDYSFIVKNNKRTRRMLFKTLKQMRKMLETGEGEAICNFAHCRYCLCKNVCEFYQDLR